MPEIYRLAIHEGTAAHYALEAAGAALPDRRVGDAALTEGPVEPHPADSAVATLADEFNRDVRVRGYHSSID